MIVYGQVEGAEWGRELIAAYPTFERLVIFIGR
jgi:hypothetical protein